MAARGSVSSAYLCNVRQTETQESFTCHDGYLWLISDLDRAKIAYRDAASPLAKSNSKARVGDRRKAKALATRDAGRIQTELMKTYGLKMEEFQALMTCGKANRWDVAGVTKNAKRASEAETTKVPNPGGSQ